MAAIPTAHLEPISRRNALLQQSANIHFPTISFQLQPIFHLG